MTVLTASLHSAASLNHALEWKGVCLVRRIVPHCLNPTSVVVIGQARPFLVGEEYWPMAAADLGQTTTKLVWIGAIIQESIARSKP